jgi:hypothetical protein
MRIAVGTASTDHHHKQVLMNLIQFLMVDDCQ